jgi:hypothetical protein
LILILGITYIIYRLPQGNATDPEGKILKVSYLKYLRNVFWIINWGLALAIIFIISNVLIAYVTNVMIGNLFFAIYRIMFWITIVGVPLYFIFLFAKIYDDKEMQRMINRGVDIRSTP